MNKYGDYMGLGGACPHAFMSSMVEDMIEIYYRTQYVCSYPINSNTRSTLTHVHLEGGNIEYYIKGTNVYRYNHETEESELIVEGEL